MLYSTQENREVGTDEGAPRHCWHTTAVLEGTIRHPDVCSTLLSASHCIQNGLDVTGIDTLCLFLTQMKPYHLYSSSITLRPLFTLTELYLGTLYQFQSMSTFCRFLLFLQIWKGSNKKYCYGIQLGMVGWGMVKGYGTIPDGVRGGSVTKNFENHCKRKFITWICWKIFICTACNNDHRIF